MKTAGTHWQISHLARKAGRFWIGCSSFVLAACLPSHAADWLNLGLLFDESPLAIGSGQRTEALGPLFYFEENETKKTWAVPPLFSHTWDSTMDYAESDFLYPISTYRRYGGEYRWQFLQLLSLAGGRDDQENQARRFTLYPLYFQQRSPIPDKNYTALVPLYGHLQGRLYRDEVFFVLWPLYVQTRKADVVTDNYLYPFFHLRHGDGLKGWQFWPLMGHQYKEPTWRTNGFSEAEMIPGHDNWFALWPFYFNQHYGIGSENPSLQIASLPFFSLLRSPGRDSTTVIWPFFTHVTDRQKKYSEWQLPWPLVIFARGEGKTATRVWPLFSHAKNANLESRFYLWPLYKYNAKRSGPAIWDRTRIMLFLYADTRLKNTETGAGQRRVDLWPLFTHRRDFDGSTRLQLFAPLEPILPASKSVERNYSPLWSVWRAEKNAKTGATSQSLLWNLFRRDTAPGSKKCSLLFGLFQYQSCPDGKRLRLFYIPVAKTKASPNP